MTITQHLHAAIERPTERCAVRFKQHREWLTLNWKDYYRSCEAVGLGLLALGIQPGDRVAIMANTRWEWGAADFGVMGIGAVTVPIYQSSRPEEVDYVLKNSGARVLFVEDGSQLRKWENLGRKNSAVEHVVCIQVESELPEGVISWDELLNRGIESLGASDAFVRGIERSTREDVATIIYTSGTTGEPKGVVLTHEQIMSEIEDIAKAFPISPSDSTLTFLPYAHVLGRVELWLHTYVGFTMNYAESIERLRSNLSEVRPTVMIGVPRIFEKIHAGLLTQIEGSPWRKRLFHWLNETHGWPQSLLAEHLIFSKLREGLGGRLRFVVSGGAPLDAKLADFFHRAGLLILEGYGLSETTAAIAVNTPSSYRFGSVGRPLADVDIKLAPDGEILVKSKKVMKGYYGNEEATRAAMEDGYFKTGDIGEWTEDGYLRITDRKKDLIKTAGGKYVAPQKIEGLLKLNPLISQVLVHGDRRKYVVALVTLNDSYLKQLARDRNWIYRDYRALTQLREVRTLVHTAVAEANAHLASFETVKNFAILPEDFSVESGELTPSLKIKRRVCDEKYKTVIDELYH
ncbi:MAG: long-chain fatty acid--CoA ligase [Bdellovibrionales bacterium]